MSTPTTATATLAPPCNPQHYPHYPHHTSFQPGSASAFRPGTGTNGLGTARLPPPYTPSQLPPLHHVYPTNSSSVTLGSVSAGASSVPRSDAQYSPTMPPSQLHQGNQGHQPESPAGKKRRRTHNAPNWDDFYRNGLPKEVIVIHDTPPPESGPDNPNQTYTTSAVAPDPSITQPAAKRRKRDSDAAPAGGASSLHHEPTYCHNQVPAARTPHRRSPATTASSSSGRNTSTAHLTATAPTSIGSSSSNSQYDYDLQPGQKRKRTTRQQVNETRRQQAEAYGDSIQKYRTPPQPIKKCGEVKVHRIDDVSLCSPTVWSLQGKGQGTN